MIKVSAKGAILMALGLLASVVGLELGIDINHLYLFILLPSIAVFLYGFRVIGRSLERTTKQLIKDGYPDEAIAQMVANDLNNQVTTGALASYNSDYNKMLLYVKEQRHKLGDIPPKPIEQIITKKTKSPILPIAFSSFVFLAWLDEYLYRNEIISAHFVFYVGVVFLAVSLVLAFTNKESVADFNKDKLFEKNIEDENSKQPDSTEV